MFGPQAEVLWGGKRFPCGTEQPMSFGLKAERGEEDEADYGRQLKQPG